MKQSAPAVAATPARSASSSPKFLDHIRVNPDSEKEIKPAVVSHRSLANDEMIVSPIETFKDRQFKYSILTDLPVESLSNSRLLEFLDDWYGTPYRYGGSTKKGIDCSAFTSLLLTTVYGLAAPRSSREQYAACMKIRRSDLTQGDLIFFNTRGHISHVGVYIGNNKFVHASTSSGVMISDLAEDYFKKRYAGSGRLRSQELSSN
jgi:hypothetical protein